MGRNMVGGVGGRGNRAGKNGEKLTGNHMKHNRFTEEKAGAISKTNDCVGVLLNGGHGRRGKK